MKDDDQIDFAALDPSRDAGRWEAMLAGVTARALERRTPSVARQLFVWARPSLLVAAACAAAMALAALRAPAVAAAAPRGSISEWAWNDEVPATSQLLELAGGDDVAR